jgi:DNA-binding transcriptional ArsR family regulator
MDRAELSALLAQGLSLAEIGRRKGLERSTVGKLARRLRLEPAGRLKYAPRPIDVDELRRLVADDATVRELAGHFGVSQTTLREHLSRHALRTARARGLREHRRGAGDGVRYRSMSCRRHGVTEFQLEGSGRYRCLACRAEAVVRRRRKVKRILVAEAGGRCVRCGYDRCVRALHFHHRDPSSKAFGLSGRGYTRGIAALRAEAEKCELLCSNCHAEVEECSRGLKPQRDTPNVDAG